MARDLAPLFPGVPGVPGADHEEGGALARAAIALLLLVIAGAASLRLTVRLAGPLGIGGFPRAGDG